MGYMHIDNLYKDGRIFDFKEAFISEKIHGTSQNIQWKNNKILYHSGGMKHETFVNIQDFQFLNNLLLENFKDVDVNIYGEGYGGKEQGMSATYGKEAKFIVFDVKIGDTWLNMDNAYDVSKKLNLEFVDYIRCDATIENFNYCRDLPSTQAIRNGMGTGKLREGVVIRPVNEYCDNRGERIIVKHKRDEFMETNTPRELDLEKLKVLKETEAIVEEWVTEMRFAHVLDKFKPNLTIQRTGDFCKAMVEDVYREAKGEIIESENVKKGISKKAGKMYTKYIKGETYADERNKI